MKKITLLICLTLYWSACLAGSGDVSEANHVIDIDAPLPTIDASTVKIYTYKPSANAKLVGKIFARGMATVDRPGELDIFGILQEATTPTQATEEDDKRLAMQALIADAARIGADALIIVRSYQVRVSANATERRIEAIAFKTLQPAPSAQMNTASQANQRDCQLSVACMLSKRKKLSLE